MSSTVHCRGFDELLNQYFRLRSSIYKQVPLGEVRVLVKGHALGAVHLDRTFAVDNFRLDSSQWAGGPNLCLRTLGAPKRTP